MWSDDAEQPSSVSVADLDQSGLSFAMTQHRENFPDNVMGRLGKGVLHRYYSFFVDSPFATALVVDLGERPVGYLVGVTDTAAHRAWLKRHRKASLAAMATEAAARHPITFVRLLRARARLVLARRLIYAHRPPSDVAAPHAPGTPIAVLSHLVIVQNFRGQGHGSRLVTAFVEKACVQGALRVAVATAHDDVAAGAFYERHGWRLMRSRSTFDGRRIQLYELRVPQTSPHVTTADERKLA